jgi:hypothetical protein
LLDDVLAGQVSAKVFVFLNAWALSSSQRAQLLGATRGSVCVWCYAPGYFDGGHTALESGSQLTGFRLNSVSVERAWATPTEAGRRLGLSRAFGVDGLIRPLLAATTATASEVLATYADGSAAVAIRRSPESTSIFVGVPQLTSELLRLAAREAKVHLFTQTDCNVYANGPFLALHAPVEGVFEVDTGRPGKVIDVTTAKAVGEGPRMSLSLKRGETRVLKY